MVVLGGGAVSYERGTPAGFREWGLKSLEAVDERVQDLENPLHPGDGFRVWGLGFGV